MSEALIVLACAIGRFIDEFGVEDAHEGEFYFRIKPEGDRHVVYLSPRGFTALNHWPASRAARFVIGQAAEEDGL